MNNIFWNEIDRSNIAVAAFNFETYSVLEAIISGAAQADMPVVVQTTPITVRNNDVEEIVYLVKHMRERYNANILLQLDHAEEFQDIKKCICAGFESVMIDASEETIEKNIEKTQEIVEYAHARDVLVEAEIGVVGNNEKDCLITCKNEAKVFVHQTGIDTLGISVGNKHGFVKKERHINFELLEDIFSEIRLPLVLHGSSGIVNEDLREVYRFGVRKINIETELRVIVKQAINEYYKKNPTDIKTRNLIAFVQTCVERYVVEKCKMLSGNHYNGNKLIK